MAQLPVLNENEVATLFRLLSVFTVNISNNKPLTEIQLSLVDDLIRSLPRFSNLSPLDRNYIQSLKSKIDVYYGVSIGSVATSNQ